MHLNVRQASELLEVSEKTLYRWIKKGEIPVHRVLDQYRFHRVELLEWAVRRHIRVSPRIFDEPEARGQVQPSLHEAVQLGGVVYHLAGSTKAEVVRSLVEALRLPEEVDRGFLGDVLLAREGLGSTAVGDGIAIPHPRSPVVLYLKRPTCTISFLERPIDYGALDGKPVDTLFTLLSPHVTGHLHLLSRLGLILQHAGLRDALHRRALREELLEALRLAEQESIPTQPGSVVGIDRPV